MFNGEGKFSKLNKDFPQNMDLEIFAWSLFCSISFLSGPKVPGKPQKTRFQIEWRTERKSMMTKNTFLDRKIPKRKISNFVQKMDLEIFAWTL